RSGLISISEPLFPNFRAPIRNSLLTQIVPGCGGIYVLSSLHASPPSTSTKKVSVVCGIAFILLCEGAWGAALVTANERLREMKGWGEFFARFKAPKTWNTKVLDERLTTNFVHYRGNYSVVAAGLLVIGIISNPYVLLALLCSALLLTFLFPTGDRPRAVRVGERTLESQERLAVAVIGVSCILGLTGAWYVLLLYGGAGVVLCLLHGVFRPRSIGSKASRVSAEAKAGFTIEVRAGSQNFLCD
ncbi:unnamed protein product, partial [Pylaiella littoralis]